MPCTPFKTPDGSTGIICSRRAVRKKCVRCGKRCSYECDFPKGKKTCDAGICTEHSLHFPVMHNLEGFQFPDSLDYCPEHAPFVFSTGQHRILVVSSYSVREAGDGQRLEVVMRPTPLGNPFTLQRDTPAERERLLTQYRRWLWQQINTPESDAQRELLRMAAICRTHDLLLQCACTPKPCHAQIIAKAIGWMHQQEPSTPLQATEAITTKEPQ